MIEPEGIIKPNITPEEAEDLVKKLYGFQPIFSKEFVSFDDRNFYMEFDESSSNSHYRHPPKKAVLKVVNKNLSKVPSYIHAQHSTAMFLKAANFNIPCPLKNIRGELMSLEKLSSSRENSLESSNLVRLLTYIDGRLLLEVTFTAELLYQSGKFIAKLDNELQNFSDSGLDFKDFIFILESASKLRNFLPCVENESTRETCHKVIEKFEANVMTKLPELPKGVLHGDCHSQNQLVNEGKICGIIDLGDMQNSAYVFEVSIALAHVLLDCKSLEKIEATGHVLAGYLSTRNLTELELEVLKDCIELRLTQVLIMANYTLSTDRSNEYAISYGKGLWSLLQEVLSTPYQQFLKVWANVVSSYHIDVTCIKQVMNR